MVKVKTFKNIVFGATCIITQSGCATFKSLDADVPLAQRVFIYSGTRLDWAALENCHPEI